MLTGLRRVLLTVVGALLTAGLLSVAPPVHAAPPTDAPPGCTWKESGSTWILDCGTPGSEGEPGGGSDEGSGPPPCDLTQGQYSEFCEGTAACWGNNPAAVQNPSELDGVEKPTPESRAAYKSCRRADGTTYDEWYWTEDTEGPSDEELARRALAQLVLPQVTPTFNPPVMTLVNLDTWWWAEGASVDPVRSPPALGVVAVAAPVRMEVDPGDGSGVLNCAVVTARSDTCTYVYRKSSRRASAKAPDGAAAYPARMRIVYDLTFELDGTPLEIEGVDTSISSDWVERPVPVREAQTVVVPRS